MRIAGVDVGEVVAVERYRNTRYSLVTMEIDDRGRPVHSDATIKIRPRLFLEGNFYLDLQPGAAEGRGAPRRRTDSRRRRPRGRFSSTRS